MVGDVSIHSLQLRREKSFRICQIFFYICCFNPLSSITKREIRGLRKLKHQLSKFQSTLFNYEERNNKTLSEIAKSICVSIHSLQLRREKFSLFYFYSQNLLFQSTLFNYEERNQLYYNEKNFKLLFQSTLFNYEERNTINTLVVMQVSSFNPLSSITKREISVRSIGKTR